MGENNIPEDIGGVCGTCGVLHRKELTEAKARIAELKRIIGDWEIFCSTLQDWNKYKQEGDATIHPEDYCHRCGNPNISWHTTNELWNRVIIHKPSILCPVCFVVEAEKCGITPASWLLTDGDLQARIKAAVECTQHHHHMAEGKESEGRFEEILEALTGENRKGDNS